jgi:hypothetical protein
MVILSHYRHSDFQRTFPTFSSRIENQPMGASESSAAVQALSVEEIIAQHINPDEEDSNVVAYLLVGFGPQLEGYYPIDSQPPA